MPSYIYIYIYIYIFINIFINISLISIQFLLLAVLATHYIVHGYHNTILQHMHSGCYGIFSRIFQFMINAKKKVAHH